MARIEGTKQLVCEVRAQCITCRKQLQRTCKDIPGKVNKAMLQPPSRHHDFLMIDLLPQIKIACLPNQKMTRNTTKLTINILVSVCMTTKYANFVLIQNKAETDLAEAITTLTSHLLRPRERNHPHSQERTLADK